MKRIATVLTLALLMLSSLPVYAQDDPAFCGIPEGCDLDGDGVVDVPAGTPAPTEDQYPEETVPVSNPPGEDTDDSDAQITAVGSAPESSGQENVATATYSPGAEVSSEATPSATLTVLPDTGGSPYLPLAGVSLLLAGAAALFLSRHPE